MPRKPRRHVPGGIYHFVVRGNNRQDLFIDQQDRDQFFHLIADGVGRFSYRVHAYCMMTNHVHFLIQVGEVSLSDIAHNLCSRYARWFNRRHGRSGHHFERRYRGPLVESTSYLLELLRYIHQNPVRAGISGKPEEYPLSSYRAFLGHPGPKWLKTTQMLNLFSEDAVQACALFADFVNRAPVDQHEPSPPDPELEPDRSASTDPLPLSSAFFKSPPTPTSLETILAAVSAVTGLEVQRLRSPDRGKQAALARAIAAVLVRESLNLSLQQLSDWSHRSTSTLSEAATAISARASPTACDHELLQAARKFLQKNSASSRHSEARHQSSRNRKTEARHRGTDWLARVSK